PVCSHHQQIGADVACLREDSLRDVALKSITFHFYCVIRYILASQLLLDRLEQGSVTVLPIELDTALTQKYRVFGDPIRLDDVDDDDTTVCLAGERARDAKSLSRVI